MPRQAIPNRLSARVALRAFNPTANSGSDPGARAPASDAEIEDMLLVRIYATRLKVNSILCWKLYWSRKMFLKSRANMIRPISGIFSSIAVWKIMDAWRELTRRERDAILERLAAVTNLSLKRTFLVIVNRSAADGQRHSPSDCSHLLTALLHHYSRKVRPCFRTILAYSILTKVFLDKVRAWAARVTAFQTLRLWALKSSTSKRPFAARFHRSMQASRALQCLKMMCVRSRSLMAICNEHLLSTANKMIRRCMRSWRDTVQISASLRLRAANVGMHKCIACAYRQWKTLTHTILGYKRMFIRQCRATAIKCFKHWSGQSSASRAVQRSADRAHDLYRFRCSKRALFVWRRVTKCSILAELKQRMSRRRFLLSSFQHFRNRLMAEKAFAVVETLVNQRGNASVQSHAILQWRQSMRRRQFLRQEFVRINCRRLQRLARAYFINFKFLLFLKRRVAINVQSAGLSAVFQWRKFLEFRHDRRLEIFRLLRHVLGLRALHLGVRASRLPLADLDPTMWPPTAEFLRANAVRQHLGIPKQIHALVCSYSALLNSSFQQCLRFELRLNTIRVLNSMRSRVRELKQWRCKLQSAVHHEFLKLTRKFMNCWKSSCECRAAFRRGCVRLHYSLLARYFKRFVGGINVVRLLEVERRSAWLACTYTRITRALHKWNDFTRIAITTHVRTGRLLNKLSVRVMKACLRSWLLFTARSLRFRSASSILRHMISSHRLQCGMQSWIESCRSAKLVTVHMSNLGRYKNLIKAWLGWSSLAVANRSHRFQLSQADMFFRSWAFRRAILQFKTIFGHSRKISQKIDVMTKRRQKKTLRRTLSAFRTRLYLFRVKSLRNQRALLHWKRTRFYQWISNTRISVVVKQCHASAKSHFRRTMLVRVLKAWFFYICKLRRAQAFSALLIRQFKYFAFTSAFQRWRHLQLKHQSVTASFGQVITTRRFKLSQAYFQLWAVATAESVRVQSAVAMGDWITSSWGFRHWLHETRRSQRRRQIVGDCRFRRAAKVAKSLLNSWNHTTKQLMLHRAMVFRCRLRLRRHAFHAWARKTKLIVFTSTVNRLSEAKCLSRIFSSWRGRSVYIREVSAAISQLGPDHRCSKTLFRHFDLWAAEASIRRLMLHRPRRRAAWILRRTLASWLKHARWSKSSRSKVHKKQKKRALKYLFISFRSWRVRAVMQICQRSCRNSYLHQLVTRSFSRWRSESKQNGGKQRYINIRRSIFKNLSPSLTLTCYVAVSQFFSFAPIGCSEAPALWPYAHDALWSLFRTHILRFPLFTSVQPKSTFNSSCCAYILTQDDSVSLEIVSIFKDCARQLLQARRNFFSVLVEMQQVYDPIACATSSISRPRPLAGTAEKAAAALFCSHICLLVLLKWRVLICYNRVRRQRRDVALCFFALHHQNVNIQAWRRCTRLLKEAARFRTVVLIARAIRYQRKSLSALQAYAVNARILGSKFEIVCIANRTSVKRNAFNWWSHSKRRGKHLYQLHCSRHLREYVFEPFRLWSQAVKSHLRLLNVHCDLVALTCSRYAPHAAPSLRTAAVNGASQAFRSTHAFWLDNPYIPFLRLCGITRAFSLWKEISSVLRFLDAKASFVLNNRISSAIRTLQMKTLHYRTLKSNLSDFKTLVKIRNLRSCLSLWHQWTKLRLRSAFSVNRGLGTESCCAILFWAMKFSPPPPVHFNWWTLYPKFRVYGTAAILSRLAKYIVYLRFARWKRAVVLARSCNSKASILHQVHLSSFAAKHFMAWVQAHCAHLSGCRSIKSRFWKLYRSRVRAQTRLRALCVLVNDRLLLSAIDYFALAVFGKREVALASITARVASRITKSFLLPDSECVLYARMQKFILRRWLQGMMRCWLLYAFACKRRRLCDKRSFFACWYAFVHSAQFYREQSKRRHEQLQRLCSISQRVDKRMKFMALRHLHALCRDRRSVFATVVSLSLRLQAFCCVKTLQTASNRNLVIRLTTSKIRLKVSCGVLRPVWRAWNLLVYERAHRKLWDRRESDAAFHTWINNVADMRERVIALEVLKTRVLASSKRFSFSSWQALVESSNTKRSASEAFFKDLFAAFLRKLFMTWRVTVFRTKWERAVLATGFRKWKSVVRQRNELVLSLKMMLSRNSAKVVGNVLGSWRAWLLMRAHRRVIGRKIESRRFTSVSSCHFSHWSALTAQAVTKMKEQYQDALIFRAEVLLRVCFMQWRLVRVHVMDCAQRLLASIARQCVSRVFSRWRANVTSIIMRRLQALACSALAHRNSVIFSFREWRLFAFSHSHVKRRVSAPDVAHALAQSGRVLLSNMTDSQRQRVMLLPRVLQVAFVWYSQRGGNNLRESILSCSVDHGPLDDADEDSSSGGSIQEMPPLSMSQLFSSQASIGPASRRSETFLEWHLPSFGAKTAFKMADVSSRHTETAAPQGSQDRAAQLQQMLEELYGKGESP